MGKSKVRGGARLTEKELRTETKVSRHNNLQFKNFSMKR